MGRWIDGINQRCDARRARGGCARSAPVAASDEHPKNTARSSSVVLLVIFVNIDSRGGRRPDTHEPNSVLRAARYTLHNSPRFHTTQHEETLD